MGGHDADGRLDAAAARALREVLLRPPSSEVAHAHLQRMLLANRAVDVIDLREPVRPSVTA